nr:hypothetical protein [Tanacetum cinerariifolium]
TLLLIIYTDHREPLHQSPKNVSGGKEDLAYQIDNIDSKKQDKMFFPRFMKIIIHHFLDKDKSISMRIETFMHTAHDDSLLDLLRIALRAKPPKSRKSQKKSDSAISSKESPSKKKSAKATKVTATKPKPTKKKAPVKADKGKGLNVLSEVSLSEAAQLMEATKRSKKDFQISQTSGSSDGTDFESRVLDKQHCKTSSTNEGTDNREEDDDVENDFEDESDNGDNDDGNNGNDDSNDDDNQEDDDTNDDDEETDGDRTESDGIKNPVLNQSSIKFYEEEEEEDKFDDEEKIDDEEKMDEEEDDEVTKELYKDVNVNLGNKDTDMTDADQGGSGQRNVSQESGFEQVDEDDHVTLTPVLDTQKTDEPVQSSFVSSNFTRKLLNLENPSPANNEIASLMDTTPRHATTVPEITSFFTTTIPPPPPLFNPLPQQATPTTSKATTSFHSLTDFSSVFRFNNRVTNLEKDLSEIKQVDQYAQALSLILAIVERYIDNKLGESIQKAIVAHNLDCREEAQAEKRDYIKIVDTSMSAILREEVNTQLPHILPQAVSDFATHVIKKNVTKSLEAIVLARSSSQPKSTYEAAASLSEFELTKILIDKMEKNKSYDKANYKKEVYDALVKSYQTDKDLFDTYGEVFMLKRSRDDRDKDQDPFTGSDRGMKRKKSSKEAESSRDLRSKEKKSSSASKDASHS